MATYLKNADLLEEIIKSKEQNKLTREAEKMLIMLANRIVTKMNYNCNADRQDCVQMALYCVFKFWRNFNPLKSQNAFSYFTEIIKRGLAQGFNELRKQKGVEKGERAKVYSYSAGIGEDGASWNL